jgi:GGDEF domain-containing protein
MSPDFAKSLSIIAMTDDLSRATSTTDVYAAFARHLPNLLPIDGVVVFERRSDPDKQHVGFVPVRGPAGGLATPFTAVWGITVSGSASVSESGAVASAYSPLFQAMGSPAALLHTPIGERALAVASMDGTFAPSDTDWRVVEGLARQAAASVERVEALQRVRELSLEDPSTGLGNRRLVELMLKQSLGQAMRGEPFSVASLRLPALGLTTAARPGGPAYAQSRLADVLREQARDTDVVARLDEGVFVIVLPASKASGAEVFLRRVVAALGERNVSWAMLDDQSHLETPDALLREVLARVGVVDSTPLN